MERKKVLLWVVFGICVIVFILSFLFMVFKGTVIIERVGLGLRIDADTETTLAIFLFMASFFGAAIFGVFASGCRK